MASSSDRITIMLDKNIGKKLRVIQAKKIQESNGTVSFSKVVNLILKNGMKKTVV